MRGITREIKVFWVVRFSKAFVVNFHVGSSRLLRKQLYKLFIGDSGVRGRDNVGRMTRSAVA